MSWQPKSPSAPHPYTQKSRQVTGENNSLYGLYGAGPSHSSQSKPDGSGLLSLGSPVIPAFQRLAGTQVWISRTVPMAPSCKYSTVDLIPSILCPTFPI